MADIFTEDGGDSFAKFEEMLAEIKEEGVPSKKELLEMLETAELNEEIKENLRALLSAGAPQLFGGYGSGPLMGIAFAVLIFCVILFFGYKLYKSIKDKEIRREEKKKQKQMKKKK